MQAGGKRASNTYYRCVCLSVSVSVCVCVRVCVSVRVCVLCCLTGSMHPRHDIFFKLAGWWSELSQTSEASSEATANLYRPAHTGSTQQTTDLHCCSRDKHVCLFSVRERDRRGTDRIALG